MTKEDVKSLTDLLEEADGIIKEISDARVRLSEIKDEIDEMWEVECNVIDEYLGEV